MKTLHLPKFYTYGIGLLLAVTPALATSNMRPAAASDAAQVADGHGRYDAHIQEAIAKRLNSKKQLRDVTASVEDGVVTLRGGVDLYNDKLRADRIGHQPDHVDGVRNLIEVRGKDVADAQLEQKLSSKLRYDRIGQGIVFNALTLSVHNGNVDVGGTVRSEPDRASALAIVETTPGVKNVVDDINVAPVSPFDDDLRIRLAQAIYGAPSLQRYANDPQAPIRIVVENGHVTLAGVVGNAMDKQIAGIQANGVSGVFSVDNKIMVVGEGVR